jgi:cytochrome c556
MRKVLFAVAAGVLIGALYITNGGAHSEHPTHLPEEKTDVIGFRAYLMENIGDNSEELNNKMKAGNLAAVKVNAQAIALHATRIPELFPKGSTSETSRAKEEIWQNWDEFVKIAHTLRDEADHLGATVANGNTEAARAQAKKVFGTCKSCHDSFRKPEKKN